MGELDGRVALVTGAGRGFGKAIAGALAAAGAAVSLLARTRGEIDAAAEDISAAGGRATAIVCDVTDDRSISDAHQEHRSRLGPTTILVNCAGVAKPVGPIGDIDIDAWWATMAINVRAPLQFMNLSLPGMREAGRGTIINVSSLAALAVIPFNSSYSVSKATLRRLTEHVAAEEAKNRIDAFAVHPGAVYTRLMEEEANSPEMKTWMPQFAALFETLKNNPESEAGLRRCAAHCVKLATGDFSQFSGKFLDLTTEDLRGAVRDTMPELPH